MLLCGPWAHFLFTFNIYNLSTATFIQWRCTIKIWISQLTFVISNTQYFKLCFISVQYICPPGHLALDQIKKLSVSLISISRIRNFPKFFLQFFHSKWFFSTSASTIAATVPARMSKSSQNNFFERMFRLDSFITTIKLIFKDHFTESHGAFKRKT